MNMELDALKNQWNESKKSIHHNTLSTERIMSVAKTKKKSSLFFHYGNVAILSAVLVMLIVFFVYIFPFQRSTSQLGIGFMMAVLALRILVELWSSFKFLRINLAHDIQNTTEETLHFFNYRKKIHGPVTFFLVALYSAGFFMLNPEFKPVMGTPALIALDIIYLIGAAILVVQIRKGIKKEMSDLGELLKLKRDLTETGQAEVSE